MTACESAAAEAASFSANDLGVRQPLHDPPPQLAAAARRARIVAGERATRLVRFALGQGQLRMQPHAAQAGRPSVVACLVGQLVSHGQFGFGRIDAAQCQQHDDLQLVRIAHDRGGHRYFARDGQGPAIDRQCLLLAAVVKQHLCMVSNRIDAVFGLGLEPVRVGQKVVTIDDLERIGVP